MSTQSDPISAISEQLRGIIAENEELREGMADVRARLQYEDAGWKLVGDWVSGDHLEGLDLEEVQMIAAKLAPRVASGSLFKRAVDIHAGGAFGRGMFIDGTEKPDGAGRPSALRQFFIKTTNQEAIFSESAQAELQKGRFIEGNVLAAVNKKDKTVNRIPFNQITGVKVDPDYPENIIAYQRTWDTKDGTEDSVRKRWYYTKRFEGKRKIYFEDRDKKRIPVDPDITIVDLRASRQPGHVLGVPDGLAGMHWAEAYAETLRNGMVVVESLARILFRVTNKTKQGVQSTGVKIANSNVMGGTASMAEGQELTAVSTAGRSYAFSENRPIAAMAAAAWNVSLPDLLADVSASGSSYGSAQAIQPSLRNAMLLMQKEWASFFKDIFEVAGLGRPTIVFEPFETPDKYRELQAITLGSVALTDEEYRMSVLAALDIVGDSSDIPDALKLRNEPPQTAAQQASPDQGVSKGTGGTDSGDRNDLRSDGIGESLRREMAMSEIVDRFEELVNRAELAANS